MATRFKHDAFDRQQDSVHKRIEETLAKLMAAVTGARVKEPPNPVATTTRSWSFPPSVTQVPMGVNPFTLPRLRLEPPRFDGENAPDWIRKIQNYYNHHYTPLDDRLYLAQYLFDHPASDWMAYWTDNNSSKGWEDFLVAVYHRFTPELLEGDSHMVDDAHQFETIVDSPKEVTLDSSLSDAAPVFCGMGEVVFDVSHETNNSLDSTNVKHVLGEIFAPDLTEEIIDDEKQLGSSLSYDGVRKNIDVHYDVEVVTDTHKTITLVSSFLEPATEFCFTEDTDFDWGSKMNSTTVPKFGEASLAAFESEQPNSALAMDELVVVDSFICNDSPVSNMVLGYMGREVELQLPHCKVGNGDWQDKAHHVQKVFSDTSTLLDLYGDARTIPPRESSPSRVLHYGLSEIEVNVEFKRYEERVIHEFYSRPQLLQRNRCSFLLTGFSTSRGNKMDQVDDQSYVCKNCSELCISVKSLGDHMRLHSQIVASKVGIRMECDDDGYNHQLTDSYINHSNSVTINKAHVNVGEIRGDDQSNNIHELRETTLKFWEIFDPKHAILTKITNACRECGKDFEALRAVFSHMKSQSHRVMTVACIVESDESLSILEKFFQIRKKRFMITSKGTVNPSLSSADASHCGVSELDEEEKAARFSMIRSSGVVSSLKFNSSVEDFDNFVYFGGVIAFCGSKIFCGNDGDLVPTALIVEKKASEFSELDVNFDDVERFRVENGMKDLRCDDAWLKNYGSGDPIALPKFLDGEIYESVWEAALSTLGGDLDERAGCHSIGLLYAALSVFRRVVCRLLNIEANIKGSDHVHRINGIRREGFTQRSP